MRKNIILILILLVTCSCFFSIEDGFSAEIGSTQIHGYIAQGYLQSYDYDAFVSGTKDGTFQFGEMGLTFSTYATRNLLLGVQFMALDFGDVGNDKIIVDWVLGDYHWKDYLGLRTGLIKIPFGFYNETRDVDMLRAFIFLPSSIYSELYRGAFTRVKGLSFYGAVQGGFSYQTLYGYSDMKQDDSLAKDIAQFSGIAIEGIKNGYDFIINLQWESLFGLKLGYTFLNLSGAEFEASSFTLEAEKMSAMVGSIEYQYGNLILASEYALYEVEFLMKPLNVSDGGEPEGFYVSGSYRFTPWFTLGAYYSMFNIGRDNRDLAEEYDNRLVVTTRFDINENWALKFEAHKITGLFYAKNEDGTKPTEAAGNDDESWYLYAAKLSYNF